MRLFIGLDVSLAKTAICVVSEHGKIVREAEVASEPEALLAWLQALDGSIAALGLEAASLSQWLHRGLTDAGVDAVLMETRQVKGALKAMLIKTDRRDAIGIARLLHLGWFRPVQCKSVSAQEVRAILSARKAIQQNMLALEMSLRGLLRNFGLKVGAISRGRFDHRTVGHELDAGLLSGDAADLLPDTLQHGFDMHLVLVDEARRVRRRGDLGGQWLPRCRARPP